MNPTSIDQDRTCDVSWWPSSLALRGQFRAGSPFSNLFAERTKTAICSPSELHLPLPVGAPPHLGMNVDHVSGAIESFKLLRQLGLQDLELDCGVGLALEADP